MTEPIADYLKRRLKEVGSSTWDGIAAAVSDDLEITDPEDRLTFHSIRKIAYGERPNLGLRVVQGLLDYFQAVERGERKLPESKAERA